MNITTLEGKKSALHALSKATNGPNAIHELHDAINNKRVDIVYPAWSTTENKTPSLIIQTGFTSSTFLSVDDVLSVETYTDGVIGIVTKGGVYRLKVCRINPVNLNETQVLALLK